MSALEGDGWKFDPEQLDQTVLAIPLITKLNAEPKGGGEPHALVIEINLEHPKRRDATRKLAAKLIEDAIEACKGDADEQFINWEKSNRSQQYLFARLRGDVIRKVVVDNEHAERPIFRIWPDFKIGRL